MKKSVFLTYEDRIRIELFLREDRKIEDIASQLGISEWKLRHEIDTYCVAGVYSARVAHALYFQKEKEKFMSGAEITEEEFYILSGLYHTGMSAYGMVKHFNRLKEKEIGIKRIETAIKKRLFEEKELMLSHVSS